MLYGWTRAEMLSLLIGGSAVIEGRGLLVGPVPCVKHIVRHQRGVYEPVVTLPVHERLDRLVYHS